MVKTIEILCGLFCILSVYAVPVPKNQILRITDESNKYYVPPSETPHFTRLEDYSGVNMDVTWPISGGKIRVDQESSNSIQLTWKKDDTEAKLVRNIFQEVGQSWKFGDAKIVIKNYVFDAVYQMWNLGDNRWYRYQKNIFGQETSDGTATIEDLDYYKDQIDLWCDANERFFHPKICAIY